MFDRSSGGQVYDEIEFGGLLDREVGRFGTLENLVNIIGGAPVEVRLAHEGCEGQIDLATGAGIDDVNLQPHSTGCHPQVPQRGFRFRSVGWIDERGNTNGRGH